MRHQQLTSQEPENNSLCYWDAFEGLSDFFAFAEKNKSRKDVTKDDVLYNCGRVDRAVRCRFGSHSASAAWGVNQLERAKKICLTPETGVLKKREEKMLHLAGLITRALKMPGSEANRRKLVRGTTGDELDIHQVNNGALDQAWTKRRKTKAKNVPTYCLAMQTGFAWSFDSARYGYVGPAIAYALLELGRRAGHNVSMVGYSYEENPFSTSRNDYMWTVPIVQTGQRLLLTNFSRFTLGIFPRYFGCYAQCHDEINEPFMEGLGTPKPLACDEAKKFLLKEHLERQFGDICTVNHIRMRFKGDHHTVSRQLWTILNEAIVSIPEKYRKHLVASIDDDKIHEMARFIFDA